MVLIAQYKEKGEQYYLWGWDRFQAGGEVASMAWGRKDSNPSFGGLLGSPGNWETIASWAPSSGPQAEGWFASSQVDGGVEPGGGALGAGTLPAHL